MELIIQFLSSLGNAILSVYEFFVDTIQGLAYCVKLLAYFTVNIPDYFGWLPSEFVAIVVMVFGIAVTYKILGREG